MRKSVKSIFTLVLGFVMVMTLSKPVNASPAPTLTKIEITDMTYEDTTGEIFVEVKYTGRPYLPKVTCNGFECKEDITYSRTIFDRGGIEIGEVRYFKTPYTTSNSYSVDAFNVYAEAKTLTYPQITLHASRIFP